MSARRMTPELLAKALELQRQGWTQARIGKEIGLSRGKVNLHLGRFNARLLERMGRQAAARLGADIQRLEWVVEEASAAWLASKGPVVTTWSSGDTSGMTARSQAGNPMFLKEVREALASIRAILGIEPRPRAADPIDDFVIDLAHPEPLPGPGRESHDPPGTVR